MTQTNLIVHDTVLLTPSPPRVVTQRCGGLGDQPVQLCGGAGPRPGAEVQRVPGTSGVPAPTQRAGGTLPAGTVYRCDVWFCTACSGMV